MTCRTESDTFRKHLYSVPWSFEHLDLSILANDDTSSVCPNVQHLTMDVPTSNLSSRFPNVHTLNIVPGCDVSHDQLIGLHHVRHLSMRNISMAPPSLIVCSMLM